MTEQHPPRRPLSSKVATYQALGQAWAARPEAAEAKRQKAAAEEAQQELLAAFKAAGFRVDTPEPSPTGTAIGIRCDSETAAALAEWLRAQSPAKSPRRG